MSAFLVPQRYTRPPVIAALSNGPLELEGVDAPWKAPYLE
jgi:hypothetical protein